MVHDQEFIGQCSVEKFSLFCKHYIIGLVLIGVVKSFRFRVLKVNYVFNNCVIAYAYRSMRNAFQFLCVERKLTIRNY